VHLQIIFVYRYTRIVRKFSLTFLLALIITLFSTTTVFAAVTWEETQPGGDTIKSWASSAMSSDGEIMIVGNQDGGIYISTNGGGSWTDTDPGIFPPDNYNWYTLAMSSNGQTILAGTYSDRVFLTTDGGDNWSETQPAGDIGANWITSSMSSDGEVMLASIEDVGVYMTTDGGDNWSETQPAGDVDSSWYTAISSSGETMLAGQGSGRLYRSTNTGGAWSEIQPAGATNKAWTVVAMSSDGEVMLVGESNGRLYLSTDGGDNWSETQPAGDTDKFWTFSSMSSDGQAILTGNSQRLYFSSNGGDAWSETRPASDTNMLWQIGKISPDAQVLLAGVYDGRLYLGSNLPPTPNSTSSSGGSAPAQSCTDAMPMNSPDLFSVTPQGLSTVINFVPVSGSNSSYAISYGFDTNADLFATSFNYSGTDVMSYSVNYLFPGTWYFKIRGQNGCMPGEWSGVKSVRIL